MISVKRKYLPQWTGDTPLTERATVESDTDPLSPILVHSLDRSLDPPLILSGWRRPREWLIMTLIIAIIGLLSMNLSLIIIAFISALWTAQRFQLTLSETHDLKVKYSLIIPYCTARLPLFNTTVHQSHYPSICPPLYERFTDQTKLAFFRSFVQPYSEVNFKHPDRAESLGFIKLSPDAGLKLKRLLSQALVERRRSQIKSTRGPNPHLEFQSADWISTLIQRIPLLVPSVETHPLMIRLSYWSPKLSLLIAALGMISLSFFSLIYSTSSTFISALGMMVWSVFGGGGLLLSTWTRIEVTCTQVSVEIRTLGIPWEVQVYSRPVVTCLEAKRYSPRNQSVLIAERDGRSASRLGPFWSASWLAEHLQESLKQDLG